MDPEEGYKDDPRAGAPLLQRKIEVLDCQVSLEPFLSRLNRLNSLSLFVPGDHFCGPLLVVFQQVHISLY